MKKQFVLLLVCWIGLSMTLVAKQDISLKSQVLNGYLVPNIVVNGKTVMVVQDRGDRNAYTSNYDRAEHIYSTLLDLDSKGFDLSLIRVRRAKSVYFGDIKGHRIFTITKGDRLANEMTSYQLALKWANNVKDAVGGLNSEGLAGALDPLGSGFQESNAFQLIRTSPNIMTWGIFIGVQLILALTIFLFLENKYQVRLAKVYDRLEKGQQSVSSLKKDLQVVQESVRGLKQKDKKTVVAVSKRQIVGKL